MKIGDVVFVDTGCAGREQRGVVRALSVRLADIPLVKMIGVEMPIAAGGKQLAYVPANLVLTSRKGQKRPPR